MPTPTFFSTVSQPNGSAKFVDAAEFDRSVALRAGTAFQIGYDSTEAQTGYTVAGGNEPLYLVLPAGKELYVYAGAVNVSILVSGSPG